MPSEHLRGPAEWVDGARSADYSIASFGELSPAFTEFPAY